jgi:hypothetical protein
MCQKISAHVNGRPSVGSRSQKPGSEVVGGGEGGGLGSGVETYYSVHP